MKKTNLLMGIVIISLLFPILSFCQSSGQSTKKTSFALHYKTAVSMGDRNKEFSKLGGQFQFSYQLNNSVGLQGTISAHRWSEMRLTAASALVGAKIRFAEIGDFAINVFGNAGPEYLMGNDYSGTFASSSLGIQVSPIHSKGMDVGIGWGQSMVLHPDHFSWLLFFAGYRF